MVDREKIIEDIEDGILMARATSTRIVHLPVDKIEEILSLLKEQETELCDRCGRRRVRSSRMGR